jgi:3-isopropylmalate/(R)-2-methylmalate dehydratase small subunit
MDAITTFDSTALALPHDDVDTDQIVPARFLKGTMRSGLADALFADRRADSPFDSAGARSARILVTGRNFGCGSSREHAVWALYEFGFRAIVAPSFADIFRVNALENGLLPIAVDPATHARILALLENKPDARFTVNLGEQCLILPDGERIRFVVDAFAKQRLITGTDTLDALLATVPAIEQYERLRPAPMHTTIALTQKSRS